MNIVREITSPAAPAGRCAHRPPQPSRAAEPREERNAQIAFICFSAGPKGCPPLASGPDDEPIWIDDVFNLRKIKRPSGIFVFDVQPLLEDEFGVWLHARRGSRWEAPHDIGRLPFDVLLLLSPERCWVAWWVDDPADKRLESDVCLAPEPEHDG